MSIKYLCACMPSSPNCICVLGFYICNTSVIFCVVLVLCMEQPPIVLTTSLP